KPQQNCHAILVDLHLELIDLFIIRDRICAKIIIAIEQAFHCSLKATLSQPSHHEHVVAQRRQRFIKCSKNMPVCDHRLSTFTFLRSRSCSHSHSYSCTHSVNSSTKPASNVVLRLFFGWICENPCRRSKLDQPAEVHEGGVIRNATGLLHVVRHCYNGVFRF